MKLTLIKTHFRKGSERKKKKPGALKSFLTSIETDGEEDGTTMN